MEKIKSSQSKQMEGNMKIMPLLKIKLTVSIDQILFSLQCEVLSRLETSKEKGIGVG